MDMSWTSASGRKRMPIQYQGMEYQVQNEATLLGERSQGQGDLNLSGSTLTGFKEENRTSNQSRMDEVKVQECVPIHNGSGDASESHSSRELKARKLAQQAYKQQLDLQVSQQKELRALEKQREAQNMTISPMRGPILSQVKVTPLSLPPSLVETKSVPVHVPCWLIPSTSCSVVSNGSSKAVTSQDVTKSMSDPTCRVQMRPLRPSLYPDMVFGHLKNHGWAFGSEEFETVPPGAESQADTQLSHGTHDEDDLEDAETLHRKSVSTPVLSQMTSEVSSPWQDFLSRGKPTVYSVSPEGSGLFPRTSAVPILLNTSDATPVLSPSPQASPCGSVIGESCYGGGCQSVAGSLNSNVSFRQHISQTADQRPGTSVRNSAYKTALHKQIEERRLEEEERRRRERLEDERLQEKIKRDQERMLEEYQEEKLRFHQKEEEKRQREEEVLARQKALIKEAEEARRITMQERRDRLSGSNSSLASEPIPEQLPLVSTNQKEPRPASPPIPTILAKCPGNPLPPVIPEYPQESGTEKLPNPTIVTKPKVPPPAPAAPPRKMPSLDLYKRKAAEPRLHNTAREDGNVESYVPHSGVAETLTFLQKVRDVLQQEMTDSQANFERQLEEIDAAHAQYSQ